ncbi:hypothetical protein SAMN05216188_11573 [Lentzea xinjiangensis]|uniref:Uncharacterized protein n=1 Tax=Lentzea xinjiangensis TaxID=402600 RepID=A0A1H9RUQ8_9PSEU|nr:hypothetical protein SAMN05216188_11573 [Lentzea xinjiangensis]
MRLSADLHEAIGVARAQGAGGLGVGLEAYSAGHSAGECITKAARVRKSSDAAADHRADPDWPD